MPFGLCNAPAVFQHFMNSIFRDFAGQFLVVYLDDILIFSSSEAEHQRHVRLVLQKLRENRLYVKIEKCQFSVRKIAFLGYILSEQGLTMDPAKVTAVLNWEQPKSLKALQRFLGFANFYRRFVKGFSSIVAPLTDLTKKNAFSPVWSSSALSSFQQLKEMFTTAPILTHPDPSRQFLVEVDASETGVGAVLSQYSNNHVLHPCAFFSRKFLPAERNYDIGNRELLAIKKAFEEWRHWLEGAKFPVLVYTDHKNLEYLESAKRLNPRQARWALFFSRFNFHISYKPGPKNVKADALSRSFPDVPEEEEEVGPILPPGCVIASISPDLRTVLEEFQSDAPNNKPRRLLFVPPQLRSLVLQQLHDTRSAGHLGVGKTTQLLSRHVWWPKLKQDVISFVKQCVVCARSKSSRRPPSGTLCPLQIPQVPWSHISMDFITDLPPSKGNTVIWVVVDRFSKMVHCIPLPKLPSAQDLVQLFIVHIFRLHGAPEDIVSDRGVQFVSQFWRGFCKSLGITVSLSSGYHPQTNGQTERANQALEQVLRCLISDSQSDWAELLPFVEFSLNNADSSSSGVSPFLCVYGKELRGSSFSAQPSALPALDDWITSRRQAWRQIQVRLSQSVKRQKKFSDRHRTPEHVFAVGDLVWLSSKNLKLRIPSAKLGPKFVGPFRVSDKISRLVYKLKLPKSFRSHNSFHVSLLKPVLGPVPVLSDPVNISSPPEFEISQVLDSRRWHNAIQYLVHWRGFGPEERSWVSAKDMSADTLVKKFHRENPTKPAPGGSVPPPQGRGNVTNLSQPASSSSAGRPRSVGEARAVVAKATAASSVVQSQRRALPGRRADVSQTSAAPPGRPHAAGSAYRKRSCVAKATGTLPPSGK